MWWFDVWILSQEPHRNFFAYLAAIVETLVALALILGFACKRTYIAATIFSFLIWSTAEGFGGPYTAGSQDVGAAIIYYLYIWDYWPYVITPVCLEILSIFILRGKFRDGGL